MENMDVLNVTWFSDEAHFYFDSYINKQNARFWTSAKAYHWLRRYTVIKFKPLLQLFHFCKGNAEHITFFYVPQK